MSSNDTNEQRIAEASPIAQAALLSALLKHVSQNQPEILHSIVNEAIRRVPAGREFEGEQSVEATARLILEDQYKSVLSEIQPASQLEGGFQKQVRS